MTNENLNISNNDAINTQNTSEAQHQIIPAEGYTTLRLIGELSSETAKYLETGMEALLKPPYNHLIVNCELLSGMGKAWFRILALISHELRKLKKEIRFVNASPEIIASFRTEGLDKTFKIAPSLREALVDLKLVTKRQLDTDFINPFLDATIQVLKVQTKTKATPGKIFLKKENINQFSGDISGVIGLISESFNGTLVISFPEQTFLKVMSRMLDENINTLTPEIADGAGEITNMVLGYSKMILNEKGYKIKTALPSIISGKNHSVGTLTDGPTVVIPFETDLGSFFIEICLST